MRYEAARHLLRLKAEMLCQSVKRSLLQIGAGYNVVVRKHGKNFVVRYDLAVAEYYCALGIFKRVMKSIVFPYSRFSTFMNFIISV